MYKAQLAPGTNLEGEQGVECLVESGGTVLRAEQMCIVLTVLTVLEQEGAALVPLPGTPPKQSSDELLLLPYILPALAVALKAWQCCQGVDSAGGGNCDASLNLCPSCPP